MNIKFKFGKSWGFYLKPVVCPHWVSRADMGFKRCQGEKLKEVYDISHKWYCEYLQIFFLWWVFSVDLTSMENMSTLKTEYIKL